MTWFRANQPTWQSMTAPISREKVTTMGWSAAQPINVVRTFAARACATVSLHVMISGHTNLWINGRMVLCSAESGRSCTYIQQASHRESGQNSRSIDSTIHIPPDFLNASGSQVIMQRFFVCSVLIIVMT
jgi:hypothetical protein